MSVLATVLVLAASASGPAAAASATSQGQATITSYELRLDARSDGSADVALTLRLDAGGNSSVRIPFAYPGLADARLVEAPPSTTFTIASAGERSTLILELPGSGAAPVALRLVGRVEEAVVEAGAAGRAIRLALMNTEPATIRDLSMVVVFPDGARAHAIREALPKPGKAELGPRATLESIDRRPGARLRADALLQGDTAVLRVDLAPVSRSPGWLIAGLILAALYLRSFRDLVASPKK